MSLPPSIHHERQHFSSLCALYAVNNFLQRSQYTTADLNAISKQFNTSGGSSQWHHIPLIGQYDVNVIMVALQRQGYDVQWLSSSSKQPVDLSNVEGVLVNTRNWYGLGRHWHVLRRFGDAADAQWVNVDSKLKQPEPIADIKLFVSKLQQQSDTHILTIHRTDDPSASAASSKSSTASTDSDATALSHAFAAASVDTNASPPSNISAATFSSVSQRAQVACQPMTTYMSQVMEAALDQYHPTNNPKGSCLMSLAENKLNVSMLAQNINKYTQVDDHEAEEVLGYCDWKGLPACRTAMAKFLTRSLLSADSSYQFTSSQIQISCGAGAVLHNIAWMLGAAGDGVMLPTPLYANFINDVTRMAELRPVFVPTTAATNYQLTVQALNASSAAFKRQHSTSKIAALIFCNPHNPTGRVYSRAEVELVIDWCHSNGVHLVSDEIYAESVWDDAVPFVSVAQVIAERHAAETSVLTDGQRQALKLGTHVHIVYGLAKDWALNGARVGILVSDNEAVQTAMANIGYLTTASSLTQLMIAKMLRDEAFSAAYLAENRRLLKAQHDLCVSELQQAGIPHSAATSGMFLLVDLRDCLSAPTAAAEYNLFLEMHNQQRIVLSPGQSMYCEAPGWYRICYAYVNADGLKEGLKRLRTFVTGKRQLVRQSASN